MLETKITRQDFYPSVTKIFFNCINIIKIFTVKA